MLTPTNSARAITGDTGGENGGNYSYEKCIADEQLAERSNQEYLEIVAKANRIVDVSADCWGALFFIVVRDIPSLFMGVIDCVGRVRIVFSVIVFILNLLVQATLLFFICKLLMVPSLDSAQAIYNKYIGKLDEIDENSAMCGLALAHPLFVRVIVFLWLTNNVAEFKDIYEKMAETVSMPALPEGLDSRMMVHDNPETKDNIEHNVVCVTKTVKVLLFLVIYIPKILIGVILTVAGTLWLMSSEQIADLILNSLALGFVTMVDELICTVFFPKFFITDMELMALACPKEEKAPEAENARKLRSFFYSSLVLACTAVIVELAVQHQPIIPNFKGKEVAPVCSPYLAGDH